MSLETEYGIRRLIINIEGSDTFGVFHSGKLGWWWSRLEGEGVAVQFDERGPFDSQIEAIADALKVLS